MADLNRWPVLEESEQLRGEPTSFGETARDPAIRASRKHIDESVSLIVKKAGSDEGERQRANPLGTAPCGDLPPGRGEAHGRAVASHELGVDKDGEKGRHFLDRPPA